MSQLQSAWWNTVRIQASFCSQCLSMRAICLLHSPSQITDDYYHTPYRRRHVNWYIVFADTPVQWMNTHRYTISIYLYKLVQLHSAILETIFDFCKSKTRMIKNFDNRIFENRLTTLLFSTFNRCRFQSSTFLWFLHLLRKWCHLLLFHE